MRLTVPVLVSLDGRDRYEARLAAARGPTFRGPSLTEVLDDLALHLMEHVPSYDVSALPPLALCPDLCLRKVRVETLLPFGGGRKKSPWKGRLTVLAQPWGDPYVLCLVPRLSLEPFAVRSLGKLDEALPAWLARKAKTLTPAKLDAAVTGRDEHLELIEVDVELPTVLSSRRPTRGRKPRGQAEPAEVDPKDRKWVPPVALRKVATSLAHRALDGQLAPAFGRDDLVQRVVRELKRPGAAVLLVGPSGVGKTAILHEVVRRLVEPHKSPTERTDFWALDGNRLIAGMSLVGAWERRVEALVDELSSRQDVLVVDDLPTLVYTGRSAQSDTHVAQFLEPYLARRDLRILAECTPERLAAARDEAPGFFGRFRQLQVPELDARETLLVTLRTARQLEADRPLVVRPEALDAVRQLRERFHAHHAEPGASVELLRRVADDARPARSDRAGRGELDRRGVMDAYQRMTGLPPFVLSPAAAESTEALAAWFRQEVLAQPHATEAFVDVVSTLQQGLDDPHRPIATLLLIGPTGVGKTETAKAMARWMFGDARRLVRFDMSEFRDPGSARRLVGGHGQPDGELTRRVAREPFAVVLFDEIEKAHSAIFDVLLQVMGEGRLTNAVGRTTDFSSTVILLTSNLGVDQAGHRVGFSDPDPAGEDRHYTSAVQAFFRPEFTNRIDRLVPFRTLRAEHVGALVQRLVARLLGRRGLRASGVLVRVDPTVVDHIVAEGFDPTYGARALARTLERQLTVPLARELVQRRPDDRTHVEVFVRDGALQLVVQPLVRREGLPRLDPVPDDWDGLNALHAATTAGLAELRRREVWRRAIDEREQALADAHDHPDALGRYDALARLRRGAAELQELLDELASSTLASFEYVDDTDVEHYKERPSQWVGARRVEVGMARPVPIDKRRALPAAREALQGARLDLALLRYRVAHLDAPADPVLVRVLPETEGSEAVAAQVAASLAGVFEPWGRVERWTREGERWSVEAGETPDGRALVVHAPGARRMLASCVGSVLHVQPLGPDLVAHLVRIDVLPAADAGVAAQLADDDAAWTAWRIARRDGHEEADPRALMPLVALSGVDGDTGPRGGGLDDVLLGLVLATVQEVR